jgi:hypothetical protein
LKFGAMTSNTDNYQGNQSTNLQGTFSIGGSPWGTTPNFDYFARQACNANPSNCSAYGSLVG